MGVVAFADIYLYGILVAFSIIVKPDIGLAKTIVSPVMGLVRKAAVAGGSAARTGAGAADIAVVKKVYSTIDMQAVWFIIFKSDDHIDGRRVGAGSWWRGVGSGITAIDGCHSGWATEYGIGISLDSFGEIRP